MATSRVIIMGDAKSTVIATCLTNSRVIDHIEQAEVVVQGVFEDQFPDASFNTWNEEIHQQAAAQIIDTVGKASEINVAYFICDLGLVEGMVDPRP